MAALHNVCDCEGRGCVLCRQELPASLNPTSDGVWEFFTDDALIELLADTSYELGRRGVRVLVG